MKTGAKVLAGAAALALLVWIGTYLYWHVRILGAVRTLESQAPLSHEGLDVLESAGCRALPYLVGALTKSKLNNQFFLMIATGRVFGAAEELAERTGNPELRERAGKWLVVAEDNPPELRAKIDAVRAYWEENGHLHHQFWRVWSSKCR